MTDLPGLVVTGASGRMGQMLIRTITASDRARLVGCIERAGHDWIGQDIGTCMGGAALGVTVTDDPASVLDKSKVDCVVIATTSWVKEQMDDLRTILNAGIKG